MKTVNFKSNQRLRENGRTLRQTRTGSARTHQYMLEICSRYVACMLMVLVLGIANIGTAWGATISWNFGSESSTFTQGEFTSITGSDDATVLKYMAGKSDALDGSAPNKYLKMNGASTWSSNKYTERYFTFKAPSASGKISITFAGTVSNLDITTSNGTYPLVKSTIIGATNTTVTSDVISSLTAGTTDIYIVAPKAKSYIKSITWTDATLSATEELYSSDYKSTMETGGSLTTSSGSIITTSLPSDKGSYTTCFKTTSSTGYATVSFATPLSLTSDANDAGYIEIEYTHSGANGFSLSINGGETVATYALLQGARGIHTVRYTIPKNTASISSIKATGSGSTTLFLFHVKVVTHSAGGGDPEPECEATADAGADKSTTVGVGVAMAATAAGEGYTGAWSIKSGSPNTATSQLGTTSSNTMTFTPNTYGTYTLVWTVTDDSDGSCSASDEATVTVPAPTHAISYTNTKGAANSNPATYSEGTGIASFAKLRHVVGYDFTGWSPSSISSSATTDQTIEAQWSANAAAAGTGTLTYALTFGSGTITTSSITRVNGALYDATDVSLDHTSFNNNSTSKSCSGKLVTTTAKDNNNYVEVTFKIADGYTFTPTEVRVQGIAVTTNKTIEVELTDNADTPNSKSVSGTLTAVSSPTTGGYTVTLDFDESDPVVLEGTVTAKIYAYGADDHWRMGTPFVITGTLASAAPLSTTNPSSASYVKGASATALSVTASGGTTPYSYQWYSCDDAVKTNPSTVGTNSASYTPGTTSTGFYYCTVTDAASSSVSSSVATITVRNAYAPTASPAAGTVASGTAITLSSSDGGTIYYTTNGDTPDDESTAYDSEAKPTITTATTIKAVAKVNGYLGSVLTAAYTIKPTPGLAYATSTVNKTNGDANFINSLTNPNSVSVSYSSSNTDVATVDSDGEVTIKKYGSATITASFAGDATYLAQDVSYTLNVAKRTYTVTYNAGTGTITGSHSDDTKTEDVTLTLPGVTFTQSGYLQTGWAKSDEGSKAYDLGGSYTDNAAADLYPVWSEVYAVEEGSISNGSITISPTSAIAGATVSLTASASSGYEFDSWTITKTSDKSDVTASVSLSGQTTSASFTMPAYDVTVAATFEKVTYTLSYNNGSATSGNVPDSPAAGSYDSGTEITVPGNSGSLEKTGYTFRGWTDGTTFYLAGQKFNITGNTTLTAVWDEVTTTTYYFGAITITTGALTKGNTGTVQFFTNTSGTIANSTAISFKSAPSAGSKAFYNSNTLTTSAMETSGNWDTGSSGNRYIQGVKFQSSSSPYKLQLGSKVATSIKHYGYNGSASKTLTIGSDSWTSNSTKETFEYHEFTKVGGYTGDVSISVDGDFYSVLEITCTSSSNYTVTFDKGGQDGATGMPANIEGVPSGKKIAEPLETPTLAGYTFDGWVTTLGGSTLFDFANTTITADKTIYAKWTALPASTTPTLPSLSNTEACAVGDFDTWNATPTNATTISAAGETVTYSWKNSSDVEVANTASYEPAAGTYTVTVTVSKAGQADASVTSDALTATLNTAASKTADPTATIAAIEGESFTISGLTASNATGYQWYSCNSTGGDKSELTGKTSATLTDTKEDAGTYYYICTIGNACGDDIDSRVVTVNVYDKCATFTSATSKQSETEAGTTKTISTETGGYAATLSGATMTFKGTSSAVGCNKDHGLVFDANDDVLTVTLTGGSLQAGTIIELGGKTVNENSKIFIFMVGSNAASPTYTTTEAANQAFTQRYVVEAGDGICGTSSFTITKSSSMTGSKEYLNKLIIANCALCTPISPTLTYSTSMLYAEPVPTTATATLTGYYGTPTISYASSNTSVATVNETTGEVTAVAPGTATITATIGETTVSATDYCGASATCVITVAGCGVQEIAGVTLTAKDAGTPSGTLIASTSGYGVNTQAWDDQSSNDGCGTGGKIGSGTYYVFLTLSSGNYFHNGDVVKLDLAKVSDVGDKNLHIYVGTTEVGTEIGTKDSPVCNVNEIVLTNVPDNTSSITLHRNDGNTTIKQNPYVKSMKVYREICSDGLAKFTGAEDSDWDKTANWTGGKMPNSEDRVVITNNMTVNVTTAQAKEIILDQSSPNTGKLTIGAGQALVVAGTIKKWNGSSLEATTPSDLAILSDSEHGTGALVVGEKSTNTRASVEFYTKACNSGGYVNQYIGIPFDNTMRAYDGYYDTYIYQFNVDEDKWNVLGNNANMEPFVAYNIMRDETTPTTLGMGGTLNLPGIGDGKNKVLNLTRRPIDVTNSVNTENLFANSWVAPIDIKTMVSDNFVGSEATVYIFNAGTYAEQQANKGTMNNNDNTNAGQWVALPVNATDLLENSWSLTVIPSMQAFAVFATGDVNDSHTLTLDYKKHVYDPAKAGGAEIKPTRSPEMRQSANEHIDVLQLFVMGEDGARDNLYVLIGDEFTNSFDNGWDGRKLSGSAWAPKMYAVSDDGNMAIHAVPEAEGTVIGFRAGQDNNYTFTFRYEGNDVLYLNDMLTETSTRIHEGFSYDFTTADGDIETRFVISHTPFVKTTPTGMDNVQGDEGQSVRKLFYQGVMYIIRGGRIYNAEGARIQ